MLQLLYYISISSQPEFEKKLEAGCKSEKKNVHCIDRYPNIANLIDQDIIR